MHQSLFQISRGKWRQYCWGESQAGGGQDQVHDDGDHPLGV